jgi:exodeoxyribonuclease V alpha subunit
LNTELQEVLNSKSDAESDLASYLDVLPIDIEFGDFEPVELEYRNIAYRVGDKVIQTCNNYDKELFNGDTGIITAIAHDRSSLTIDFAKSVDKYTNFGKPFEYTKSELSEVQHAYVISANKCQGSEYPVVILLLTTQHSLPLQRNLLYTGITRARRKVYIVGSLDVYSMAVKNNEQQVRRTHLQSCLRKAMGEPLNDEISHTHPPREI